MGPVAQRIDAVKNGGRDLYTQFAKVDCASTGNNTLVAVSSGNKIRVLAGLLVTATATTIKFQSGAGGTDLTGAMTTAAGTPVVLPYSPLGHFETAASALLNLSLGGNVQTSGWLVYVLISG